jgi:hypothetical protein
MRPYIYLPPRKWRRKRYYLANQFGQVVLRSNDQGYARGEAARYNLAMYQIGCPIRIGRSRVEVHDQCLRGIDKTNQLILIF